MVHIVLTVIYVMEYMCIYMFSCYICYGVHTCIYAVHKHVKYRYYARQEVSHNSRLKRFYHILLFYMYICGSETIIN